jgi:hypothetical protein
MSWLALDEAAQVVAGAGNGGVRREDHGLDAHEEGFSVEIAREVSHPEVDAVEVDGPVEGSHGPPHGVALREQSATAGSAELAVRTHHEYFHLRPLASCHRTYAQLAGSSPG